MIPTKLAAPLAPAPRGVRALMRECVEALRARPALAAFACAAAGLVLARELLIDPDSPLARAAPILTHSSTWFGLALGMLIVGALARGWACRAALGAACLLVASGWFVARIGETPASSLLHQLDRDPLAEPVMMTLHGVVEGWPEEVRGGRGAMGDLARGEPSTRFMLRVCEAKRDDGVRVRTTGKVMVRVLLPIEELPRSVEPGAALRVTGRVEPVRGAMNPGELEWDLLARQENRAGTITLPSVDLIGPSAISDRFERVRAWGDGVLGAMRRGAVRSLAASTGASADGARGASEADARARALLGAMLLGERSRDLDDVNHAFARQGLLHLVAISGFNLAVMGGVALVLVRLGGDRGWIEPVAIGVLVALYLLILPAEASIVRSGVMMLTLMLVEATGRRYDAANLMGWIGIGVLAWRPMDLWSPGFQLSFAIVAALLLFGSTMRERLFGVTIRGVLKTPVEAGPVRWWRPSRWKPLGRSIIELLKTHAAASILAWTVAAPIIAWHSGVLSPLAPLTSLVVLPLSVVVLWVGYAVLFIAAVAPSLGETLSGVLTFLGSALGDIVMRLDAIPGTAVHMPSMSWVWAWCMVGAIVLILAKGHRRSIATWGLVGLMTVWTLTEVSLTPRLRSSCVLRIDTLSVGDGTCHLLRTPSESMLWDCGSLATGVGERMIPRAVRTLGAGKVETVLITHAHLDHFAGLPDVVEPLGVKRVLISNQMERLVAGNPESGAAVLLARLRDRGVEIRTVAPGTSMAVGGVRCEILWPPIDRDFRDTNDASLVAMLHVPSGPGKEGPSFTRVLLTGDISRQAVPELLPDISTPEGRQRASDLHADVMELPHHGAFLEAKAELLRIVNPRVVVQSTGAVRARDQRWNSSREGREWYITARDGAAYVEIEWLWGAKSGSLLKRK